MTTKFGVSNHYLNRILYSLPLKRYRGCFAIDNVPISQLSIPSSIICNLSRRGTVGSHFIVLHIDRRQITLQDSFGKLGWMLSNDLKKLVKQLCSAFQLPFKIVNETAVQDEQSDFCGFFAMQFVLEKEIPRRQTKKLIRRWKPRQLQKNDFIVIENIINLIKTF